MNYFFRKANSLIRYVLTSTPYGNNPYIVISEFPKSGGTWIAQMISEAIRVPFPRNTFPSFYPCIFHGHYFNINPRRNTLIVFRDGRDTIVSWYYHCFFVNERSNKPFVEKMRKLIKFDLYDDIKSNLPVFIDFCFNKKIYPKFSWSDFVRHWFHQTNTVHVFYEDFNTNAFVSLKSVLERLSDTSCEDEELHAIVDKYSFKKQSGRKPGKQDCTSFMRKGIVGDWVNHFNRETSEMFEYYAGDELRLLGYEIDNNWINKYNF